jgi:hypothetical protein
VVDERTVAFPNYDGNGMYLSVGNMRVNPHVGMLFVDFRGDPPRRLRLNGEARIEQDDPLEDRYPGCQFVVRVGVAEVFPNCPRYIHEYRLVKRSRFVPKTDCETPVPAWKRSDWAHDALAENDPANDPSREVIPR